MKARLAFAVLTGVLVFAVFSGDQAYGQLGFISGEILDEAGNPVADVAIRIEGLDNPRKLRLKSDKKGKYLHAGVPIQGTYRIIAEKEGFTTEYVDGVRPGFTRDDERGVVDFSMKPGRSGPVAFDMSDEQRAELARQQEEAKKQAEALEQVRAVFSRGVNAFNLGQFEEAATAFEEASRTDPSQAVIWGNLASTYSRLDQHDKAIEAYIKAVELEPDNSAYLQNLGSSYAANGDDGKAREMYEKAASLSSVSNPKDAATNYYNMGVTYINAGKNDEAIESLNKALELDPSHSEAHYQLGISQLGAGQMDECISHLKKYLELAPTGPNAETAKALIEQLGG
jgi:Flp pilus assembly protein TadD